jgi:hypothetical protein
MSGNSNRQEISVTGIVIFCLRNLVLAGLLVNAYLHFREELNLVFVIVSFALAVLIAVWMERVKLRFIPALAIVVAGVVVLRFVFFLFFRIVMPLDSGIETDFLFLNFDKDFFPSLVPCMLAWLFNFFALRNKRFVPIEAALNALILALVFVTESNFNITIYHPTFFGIFLTLFVFAQIAVLVLAWTRKKKSETNSAMHTHDKRAALLSYVWIIVPLLFLLVFYFVLMNMYNNASAKSRGGLMESTLLRFDFSKYVKLESEIKLSDDLVMIFRKNGPAQRLLLRRFVLSKYDSAGGFYQSDAPGAEDIPMTVPDSTTDLPDPGFSDRQNVTQDYFFVNLDPTSLIAMNYPVNIMPLRNWDASSFLRIYRVVSKVSQFHLNAETADTKPPRMDQAFEKFYTDYGNDKKIKVLAEEVTVGMDSYFSKVLAIENYLIDNYLYSLKPGLATGEDDGNQLHRFLFTSKKGYCSYFAFAMALMCRSLGIPARVAVGFFANPEWEVLNFYEIRANQAHAWVEVYFGDLGWIEFDPTSNTVAPGEDISFMLNFELSDKLKNLISEILENESQLTEEENLRTTDGFDPRRFSEVFFIISSWLATWWFIVIPAFYLLIIAALKRTNYLLHIVPGNPRRRAKHLYMHTLTKLYGISVRRNPGESLLEFARRIDAESPNALSPIVPLAEGYLEAVFAERFEADNFTRVRVTYREFARAFARKYNPLVRALGFLNPVIPLRRT